MIYLDNAATTKPCPEAVQAALEAMTDNIGNPSSLHRAGRNARVRLRAITSLCAEFPLPTAKDAAG